MNQPRPFYSPRTPSASSAPANRRTISSSSFPFPRHSTEEEAESGLLSAVEDAGDVTVETEGDVDDDIYGGGGRGGSPESTWEGMTPLDETLEKIGMKRYQWSLLVLCGFGWMADNMWLQCIAVILPRVQEHYQISDRWSGVLSASIFAGMMFGAWGWGSYSDSQGRTTAFNLTLLLTSIFGLASAFAPSFAWLCIALFGLGTGVGGSMPTDGTLFLENIPKTHHYLLTALSAFFSLGAVLTSLLGLYIIPRYSCPEHPLPDEICNVDLQNNGWRYMLATLGIISIIMFLCRIIFFRLQESAKFLVTVGRPSEAVISLQRISKINGEAHSWSLADVIDEVTVDEESPNAYAATESSPEGSIRRSIHEDHVDRGNVSLSRQVVGRRASSLKSMSIKSRREGPEWLEKLPEGLKASVEEYLERLDGLFEPEWARTTKLVWIIWGLASGGYTIFNVFLPKYLEEKVGQSPLGGGREQSLKDYVLYTVSGMPGSIIGAYLIETSWGRRGTMAISTLATSLGILVFVLVSSQAGVVLSSMGVSLAATLMYAVIYGYTPEVFEARVRGTACGIASALSRLAGIVAPIITGLLLSVEVSLPLYVSALCFAITAACMFALPIETRGITRPGGSAGFSH